MITRLTVLLTLFMAVGVAAEEPRPNVLMIVVDDLNDFPGFMRGYPDAKTPHMDKLAAQGTVFTRAHCQYPLCGPSRASFMSGMLPSTLNFAGHMADRQLERRCKELGTELLHSYFGRQGYKTLAVGKICHRHVPKGSVDASGGRGGFRQGTGRLRRNWHQNGTSTDWAMAPEKDSQLPDYDAAAWAMEQLEAEHEQPFLLMVGFLRPHVPWYVPKKWFDLYDKEKLTLPPYQREDLEDVPAIAQKISILPQYPRTEWALENNQWRNILHAYLACISFTDHYVGRVLHALRKSPYGDNTIVVLLSDHGYHMGEKNTFQKQTLWERSSHVPLVISGPGVRAVQRCERVVSLLDIYPTVLDMCGLPENPKNEGHSLTPLLKDPDREWPHKAITSWEGNNTAIQGERYRYMRYVNGSEELYDHENDPNEWTNLAREEEYEPIKERMTRLMPETKFRDQ